MYYIYIYIYKINKNFMHQVGNQPGLYYDARSTNHQHPKHVAQFPDRINCVTLHLVGYILEYYYDARAHER